MSVRARLLVVDDEQSMREFLEIFFRKEGFEVQVASSVDEALAFFDACEFDVVISDIQMPERTGIELLKEVQRLSPETVVIMITAFSTTETAIDAMKLGAYDYITKPFKVDAIRLVVEKALEK
ncbi:MAG: sigma-54-dependent Fis family transcriptional regulator, partial [Deltaproteobacteria bacterium]|nr:sigma-54-dependent Fis family transcriptional regulator [Deltaproteobacteria bacterium]